eukprot:TRINITY_DN65505_c0_g1_i1.p1 TRINITY_DN65505_c0_g1~~TRINITY_DN65505_c0_g1_i1.p1  ORF type:complete len:766 (-),score=59.73 TRINITY_DN65505_c0_g1_i1:70-2289(-)
MPSRRSSRDGRPSASRQKAAPPVDAAVKAFNVNRALKTFGSTEMALNLSEADGDNSPTGLPNGPVKQKAPRTAGTGSWLSEPSSPVDPPGKAGAKPASGTMEMDLASPKLRRVSWAGATENDAEPPSLGDVSPKTRRASVGVETSVGVAVGAQLSASPGASSLARETSPKQRRASMNDVGVDSSPQEKVPLRARRATMAALSDLSTAPNSVEASPPLPAKRRSSFDASPIEAVSVSPKRVTSTSPKCSPDASPKRKQSVFQNDRSPKERSKANFTPSPPVKNQPAPPSDDFNAALAARLKAVYRDSDNVEKEEKTDSKPSPQSLSPAQNSAAPSPSRSRRQSLSPNLSPRRGSLASLASSSPGEDVTNLFKSRIRNGRLDVSAPGSGCNSPTPSSSRGRPRRGSIEEKEVVIDNSCNIGTFLRMVSPDSQASCSTIPSRGTKVSKSECSSALKAKAKEVVLNSFVEEHTRSSTRCSVVKTLKRNKGASISVILSALALGLFIAAASVSSQSNVDGLQVGSCFFLSFADNVWCGATCTFEIGIQDLSKNMQDNSSEHAAYSRGYHYTFKTFEPQKLRSLTSVSWASNEFRCCGSPQTTGCCEFRDENSKVFCDSFHDRVSRFGEKCPDAGFECYFRVETDRSGGAKVTEVKTKTDTIASDLSVIATVLCCLAAVPWIWKLFWKVITQLSSSDFSSSQSDVEAAQGTRYAERGTRISTTSEGFQKSIAHPFAVDDASWHNR